MSPASHRSRRQSPLCEEFMVFEASPTRLRCVILSRRKLTMMRSPSGRSIFWAGIASYPIRRSRLSYGMAGVTLTGDVDWHFQKKSAEDAIRKLSGVRGIVNSVAIKPSVQATDVKKKI